MKVVVRCSRALATLALASAALPHGLVARHAGSGPPIPAFSRMYGTSCSTCHTAAPKLNSIGESFRLNGYRMPESDLLIRRDGPVPLGTDAWKDRWPRAIWPGSLPGQLPMAIRVESDVQIERPGNAEQGWTYRLPHEVALLAATTFGDGIGVFVEGEWSPAEGFEVAEAKVLFQGILPFLPERVANAWVGLLNPVLLSFTDRQVDLAARQDLSWQSVSMADLVEDGGGPASESLEHRLGASVAAVELNGLIGSRMYWGAGLAQGLEVRGVDGNDRKDVYVKVRGKLGGLDLRGRWPSPESIPMAYGGQLLDRTLILEGFAYFGDETRGSLPGGRHRALGGSARALLSRVDAGVGVVRRDFEAPWSTDSALALHTTSVFARMEFMALPWVIASLKVDRLRTDAPVTAPREWTVRSASADRLMPGVILLLRQNIRVVAEGEFFTRHDVSDGSGTPTPNNLWIRLDLAF